MNEQQTKDLSSILAAMAIMAPEIDAMGHEEKLKTFELFGSMIDAAIAEQTRA